jgi:hypothetical protein
MRSPQEAKSPRIVRPSLNNHRGRNTEEKGSALQLGFFVLLVTVGQEKAWRAVHRRRQMGEFKRQNA